MIGLPLVLSYFLYAEEKKKQEAAPPAPKPKAAK
jgi:hypothetical protein